ncbi:MAG: type II toxin-antitoxin system VapC family toxin [Actinomycetota bacterium]|nr:type II toxin-antitoxin system VapC family toxin [Actinomycetota bacterium]
MPPADRLIVVDASVALKWAVTEPGSDDANVLLDGMINGEVALVAPEHLLGEVGNGLRKRVAQRILAVPDALAAFEALIDLEMEFIGGSERWRRSLSAALDWGVTTYDAIYILLAMDLGSELITADQRLADCAHARSLPVRTLTA